MKKILLILTSLTLLFFGQFVYAGSFNTGGGNYTVIDNTKDGVHDSMADTLIDIGTKYLDGTISPEEARSKLSEYINQVSGGGANAEAHFDSNGALHIGCTNNGSLIILTPNGTGLSFPSSSSGGSSSGGEPPVTCTASSYTTYSYGPWSTCNIGTNTWSASNNSISCSQTRSVIPYDNTCQVCSNGVNTCQSSETPGPSSQNGTISLNFSLIQYTGDAFANNSDKNQIIIPIQAPNEGINWAGRTFSDFEDVTTIKSNRIDNTGEKALSLSGKVENNKIIIDITSIAPVDIQNGKILFKEGIQTFNISNVKYDFKKPFIGYIETWNDIKSDWTGSPSIGTLHKYKVGLTEKSTLTWAGLSSYAMDNFSNDIEPNGAGLKIESKSVSPTTLSSKTGTEFTARINTSESATELNNTPGLQINLPIISYQLGGQTVKYYLSEQEQATDMTPIKTTGSEFLGVRVIGGIQGAGKSEFTGQQANISNLYNSEQRTILRKNAYNYVKNMSSGQIVNGVKYVKGNTTISGNLDYETLVVVDGNVIFDNNFIPTKLKGIIVLKDNYDVMSGYDGNGNVYITPNVTQINAIIYADGGIISADNSGKPYTQDTLVRSQSLQKQLIFNGSVFTRNTIGGAILAGGSYVLPGGTQTADFNNAMIYDLNYIRRANVGCDKNNNANCTDTGEYKDPFVIKYDSRVQLSPPKLFEQ